MSRYRQALFINALLLFCSCVSLTACGQKGPLVDPNQAPEQEQSQSIDSPIPASN